jgi:hypothetical protein
LHFWGKINGKLFGSIVGYITAQFCLGVDSDYFVAVGMNCNGKKGFP